MKMFLSRRTKVKIVKWASAVIAIVLIGTSAYPKANIDATNCPSVDKLLEERREMDDPCLIQFLRSHRISLPSSLAYNFSSLPDHVKLETGDPLKSYFAENASPWVEALLAVETFVPKRERRTFLECGALDGITFSTTFHLENFLNWTGVLIEADPIYYQRLQSRNRKAYTVQACASSEKYPLKLKFKHANEYEVDKIKNKTYYNPGGGQVVKKDDLETSFNVLCVPVYTILLATGVTKIDLFVLDVEGMELDVLKTIPFDKVDIGVFLVEINRPAKEWEPYFEFFASKGYSFHGVFTGTMHPNDAVFVKNEYYHPEKLTKLTALDAYKIITGEIDEGKIPQGRLLAFATYFQFSGELSAKS